MTLRELERAAGRVQHRSAPDAVVRRRYLSLVAHGLVLENDANYLLFALAFRSGADYAAAPDRNGKAGRDGG